MTYVSCLRFAVLACAAFLSGTPAFAQSTSVSTDYLMTVYIQKDPALAYCLAKYLYFPLQSPLQWIFAKMKIHQDRANDHLCSLHSVFRPNNNR